MIEDRSAGNTEDPVIRMLRPVGEQLRSEEPDLLPERRCNVGVLGQVEMERGGAGLLGPDDEKGRSRVVPGAERQFPEPAKEGRAEIHQVRPRMSGDG